MKNKQNNRAHTASVQTARATSPYKVLDRYVPLSKPEFAVYDAIREAVPMVDAAILKIVRLVDNFNISCSDIKVEKELKEFMQNIPTGMCSKGIGSFITSYLDSLLTYGTAVAELAYSKNGDVLGVYNAPLKNISLKRGKSPFHCTVSVRQENGSFKEITDNGRILLTALHPTADCPEGNSLLKGMPFVTSVLLKIFDSVGTNFERIGNLRYAVTYKPNDAMDSAFSADRAAEIAKEWSAAMSDHESVRDFVAVGDVDIKVIGADNNMIETEIPVRQMLEQIVAKTGIPPFMLGISWSSTERMASVQNDMLTSELQYYRSILEPVIKRICSAWLLSNGYLCSFNINWNEISLQDEVELAKARLYNAQAAQIEAQEVNRE